MPKIYRYSSNEELMSVIDPSREVFVDTETAKLGSQIRLVQVYQEGWDQVLLFDTPMVFVILQNYHLVGHNLLYDLGCLRIDLPSGAYKTPAHWDDTFYLSRLTFPEWNTGKGFSLDAALTKVMGYDPYAKAGIDKKKLQMSFERISVKGEYVEGKEGLRELTEQQLLYAAIDVYELPKLYNAVKHMRDHFVYKLDIDVCGTILTDTLGMPVDTVELLKLEQEDIATIASVKREIGQLNCNSWMQVRKALGTVMSSDEMALRIIENREGGLTGLWTRITMTNGKWAKAFTTGLNDGTIAVQTRSFGKARSIQHSSQLPKDKKLLVYFSEINYVHTEAKATLATLINTNRKSLKRLNFVDRARRAMVDGRVKGTFSPHAINGRIQVDNENLSQYPRAMKKMWGHPKESARTLISADFAQVELRAICAALPEMNMYKALKGGQDLHSYVAEQFNFSEEEIAMLPPGQNPRQVAKQSNFLLLYGGGVTNFQRVVCRNSGVWFSDEASQKIVTKWKGIFSDVAEWQKANSKSTTKMDKTVMGRPYKASTVTDLNNIKISGTGAEIFKVWLRYIQKYILSYYSDVYIVNRVHDCVVLDSPHNKAIYEPVAKLLALTGQKAWFEVIANAALTDVPMGVDVGVDKSWKVADGVDDAELGLALSPMFLHGTTEEEFDIIVKEIRDGAHNEATGFTRAC